MGDPPPRIPDTFTFSQQLRHQLNGLALVAIEFIAPWERVVDLQFARRPGEPALWHLYVEVIGKYSNAILTHAEQVIVTAAHQVSSQQSSVRPIQTGQVYEKPPALRDPVPTLTEPLERWRSRLNLIPGPLGRALLKNYRGLSTALVASIAHQAGLDPEQGTDHLTELDWQNLYYRWQSWLEVLETHQFQPEWTKQGYSVLGWDGVAPARSVQALLNRYYCDQLNQQEFKQLRHQLSQKLSSVLKKLQQKADLFSAKLQQSDHADQLREQADLLMAYLHEWQPGMQAITLNDFVTAKPVTIALHPEKNAVQNAQMLYKQHQKLKRSRSAVEPLLIQVQAEIDYLSQVDAALSQIERYDHVTDLLALREIRDELIQEKYLEDSEYSGSGGKETLSERLRQLNEDESSPHRYRSPSGFEVLVGRNNRQNDWLTFRLAGDYDLWFHTQEIPGSHVLLRLQPGTVPEEADLQFASDLAAYFSRARQSEQVSVVYTQPRYVFKPKGAQPGMTVYQKEQTHWGKPHQGSLYLPQIGSVEESSMGATSVAGKS
jgi:predicted ribosome quality control (RQC) complex YloA/Tae2 family protein